MTELKKRVFSFLAGVVTTFFQMYGAILGLVCAAIIFDTITGVSAAKATGKKITSKKANQGFWKKIGLLMALFFGVFIDMFIHHALSFINITIPFNMPFGLIFGCYIIFNEGISICENLDKINPNILPKWVKKMLEGGSEKIDSAVSDDKDNKEES